MKCKDELIDLLSNKCSTCNSQKDCQIKALIEHAFKHIWC